MKAARIIVTGAVTAGLAAEPHPAGGNLMKLITSLVFAGSLLVPIAAWPADGITDPQIAAIVVAANQVDIDAGNLAASSASHADVKAFGRQMVTDHTRVNKQATELVTTLKVTPEENEMSKSLRSGGDENLKQLRTLHGAAFDKAYVDHEVAYHQQVLDALDKTLIPGASNEQLKALLVKVRPAFVAHMEHAKQLQSTMSK